MDSETKLELIASAFCGTMTVFFLIKSYTNFKEPSKFHWNLIRRWFMLADTLLMTVLCTTCLLQTEDLHHPSTWFESFIGCLFLGHFMFDMVYVLMVMPCWTIVIHHTFVFIWLPTTLYFDRAGCETVITITVGLCSDILLHTRDLIRIFNQRSTGLYFLVELLFFTGFFIPRLTFTPFMIVFMTYMQYTKTAEMCGFVGLTLQSYYLGYHMIPIIKKRFAEFQSALKMKKKIQWMNPFEMVVPERIN